MSDNQNPQTGTEEIAAGPSATEEAAQQPEQPEQPTKQLTPAEEKAALLAEAHAALDAIFYSGSPGPSIANTIIGVHEAMQGKPKAKVRAFIGHALIEMRGAEGTDYATSTVFDGNPIMVAAALKQLDDMHAYRSGKRMDRAEVARALGGLLKGIGGANGHED